MNLIVAASTGILCAGFCRLIGINQWDFFGLFAFFSTLAVYNGQRIYKSSVMQRTPWLLWVYKNITALTVMVFISTALALFFLVEIANWNAKTIILLASSSLISTFYIVRIAGVNLRELPYIKIHMIALSWTGMLILYPMINESISDHLLIYAIAHYLYVVGITIPFDIRDLKYDKAMQRTIPQVLGVNWARILAAFLILSFSILMLYTVQELWYSPLFYLAVAIQLALAIGMNENQSDVYCAGGIDGAIALLGLAYFLL